MVEVNTQVLAQSRFFGVPSQMAKKKVPLFDLIEDRSGGRGEKAELVGVMLVPDSGDDGPPKVGRTTANSRLVRELVIQCRHAKLMRAHCQQVGRQFHNR
jgi:hypothetical protein